MNKVLIADLSLFAVAIFWGGTFLMVQYALSFVGVFSFLFWRFFISCVLMWLILLKFDVKFDRNSVICGLFLGIFLFGDFVFQTWALKFALSSSVAFIVGLSVVIVPFLMFIFFGVKIGIFSFLSAIIALIGLYFLSGASVGAIGLGEILSAISTIFYALYVVFTGKFVKICNIFALVCAEFFAVAILAFIFALNFDEISLNSVQVLGNLQISTQKNFIIIIFAMSMFATIVAFFVQTFAQIYTTATKVVLIFTLEPVVAGILGYFWGEKLLMTQIFGAILILVAILISEISNLRKSV